MDCIRSISIKSRNSILFERIELCGNFASEKCFGAVIYIPVQASNSDNYTQVLCSKSRVAPLKTLSVPRLELSACLLLAKLVNKVVTALKFNLSKVNLFSDLKRSLCCIKTSPHLLKTSVAHKVAKFQELTESYLCQRVPSAYSPAELLSRCLNASELVKNELCCKSPDPSKLVHTKPSQNNINEIEKEFKTSTPKILLISNNIDFFNKIVSFTNNLCKLICILSLFSGSSTIQKHHMTNTSMVFCPLES